MAAIDLGSFTNIGGKTVTSGLASGLDTEGLVNSIIEAKTIPVTRLEDRQTLTSDKISAYGELKSLLSTLRTSVDFLRNPPSVISSNTNLFTHRQAFITSNTSISGNTYVGVSADPNASLGNYIIEDISLAKTRILRSDAFTSKIDSVTDAAATNNANRFSAGTFQLTGGKIKPLVATAAADILAAADISTTGTVGTAALNNAFGTNGITFTVGGDFALIGDTSDILTKSAATQAGGVGTDATITLTINGKDYVSNSIAANTGGGSDEIAANTTILFTESVTGAAFQLETGAAIAITGQGDLDTLAANIEADLQPLSFFQQRELGTFDETKATGTTLNNLLSAHVQLTSNAYDKSTGVHGNIEAFSVTAVSGAAAADGQIEVVIDGETYRATGLGDGADQITGNVVLTSITTNKSLALNFGDAGITLDISTAATALPIERDLNTVFGAAVDITINEGDNLLNIANAINSKKTTTGVSATIIEVSPNDFRLTIQSEEEGIANSFNFVDVDDVFSSTVNLTQTQAAKDATFLLNNDLTITRSTNVISDVVGGVTFSLFQDSPVATEISVDIDKDTTATADAVITFLNAYNGFKTFVAEQRERDADGLLVETAVVGTEPLLETAISRFEAEINGFVTGLTSLDPSRLGDVGITFTNFEGSDDEIAVNNILTLDQNKLANALANNFDAVRRIFEFTFTSSSSDLQVFERSNALAINDFSVDVDITRSAGDQVRISYIDPDTLLPAVINADFTAGAGTGGTITGQDGTVIEGLKLIYTGDGTDVITVNAEQGIADRLYNAVNDFTKTDGLIDLEVASLNTTSDRFTTDILRLNERIDTERIRLLIQFSTLEERIGSINVTLQFLDAQLASLFGS